MGSEAVNEELEKLKREIARLYAELDSLKIKVGVCYELVAELRGELEHSKRRSRRPSLQEHVGALRAYEMVGADELEPQ
jgi:regulator of replication initiation timing